MAVVTMRQLLESGVHFGHQTRRWDPKMKPYILTERNGIYIVDLQQTLTDIDVAYEFVKQTVARGGSILFVGTKKQAQETVEEQASRVGMPYVNHRWLGGMLTNFATVSKRLQHLKELEQVDFEDTATSGFTKKELLMKRREKDKLTRTLGGIREMGKLPSAVWVVDTLKEHLAVAEARKLNIPVIAILDTNCNPEEVDYGIPGNDDAIRAVSLLTRVIADGVAEGLLARSASKEGEAESEEPLAEWERELLELSKDETVSAETDSTAVKSDAESDNQNDKADNEKEQDKPVAASDDAPEKTANKVTEKIKYSMADLKSLREETGAGMMDVKNALVEAEGDLKAALKIIRLKGLKSLSKRDGRDATAGLVVAQVSDDASSGIMVEVNSETDFVAKNQKFIDFAQEVLAAAVTANVSTVEELLASPMGEGTVQDQVNRMGATVGEKTEIGRVARISGDHVDLYLHQTNPDLPAQVGVLVATDAPGKEVAHDVAMHVAAYRPRWVSRNVVPQDVIENERQTLTEITLKEGKPEHIVPKIVEGRLDAFYKENTLVDQDYARDATVTVGKVLEGKGANVTEFVRFQVGS